METEAARCADLGQLGLEKAEKDNIGKFKLMVLAVSTKLTSANILLTQSASVDMLRRRHDHPVADEIERLGRGSGHAPTNRVPRGGRRRNRETGSNTTTHYAIRTRTSRGPKMILDEKISVGIN